MKWTINIDTTSGDMEEADQVEVDYVKALSLSQMEFENEQDLIIERKIKETLNVQTEEDEQLANAMQLSLVMASSKAVSSAFKIICAGCNNEISRRENRFDCNGIVWHVKCLQCHACIQMIKDDQFYMVENRPYHKSCARNKSHLKCYVCNDFIPYIGKEVEYGEHPFWAQKYCPSHEDDGTSKCASCERLKPKGREYILLQDGRSLCVECSSFMILDTNECQPLFREIQEYFTSLDMKLDQKIPLLLVEREALNEAMKGERNGHHHLSETRGLCVSEEQIIPVIHKRKHTGRNSTLNTQPFRPVRSCEVNAILILYGLPRLLTGSILAHEMMHAWLRLQGYPNLKPEIEEGICQVLAHMWLKSKINMGFEAAMIASSSSTQQPLRSNKQLSKIEQKLGECFVRQIELDNSEAYGDGFRVGEQAVSQYGLKETLHHIKHTRTFPF